MVDLALQAAESLHLGPDVGLAGQPRQHALGERVLALAGRPPVGPQSRGESRRAAGDRRQALLHQRIRPGQKRGAILLGNLPFT